MHVSTWNQQLCLAGGSPKCLQWSPCRDSFTGSFYTLFCTFMYCFIFNMMCADGLVSKSCPTLVTPWTVCSLPGSSVMGFSRQEYWSGLPFPSPGDLPDPGIEPRSPVLGSWRMSPVGFFTSEPAGKYCFKYFSYTDSFPYSDLFHILAQCMSFHILTSSTDSWSSQRSDRWRHLGTEQCRDQRVQG